MRYVLVLLLLVACTRPAPPPPPVDRGDDPIVARVGDEVIRRSEAERRVAMEIFRRRVDIHSLVSREVDALVERRLLEREAERRGTTVDAMLDAEVDTTPVAEAEVDAYLAEHDLAEDKRPRARNYLDGRRRIEQRLAFVAKLRERAGVEVTLAPPEMPRVDVDIEGAPSRGPNDAPVTIVHFGAFTDPRSAELAGWIAEVRERHPQKIREVFRHALKPRDELGLQAALLARDAQKKDRFWSVYDALFRKAGALRQSDLQALRAELELDAEPTDPSAASTRIVALREELEIAQKSGVHAPPVAFVNGLWFQHSFGEPRFESLVRDALSSPTVRESLRK